MRTGGGARRATAAVAVAAVLALVAASGCDAASAYPRFLPPPVSAAHPFLIYDLAGLRPAGHQPAPNPIALTFDDGPSPFTHAIAALLHDERVPATFFIIGRQVAGREQDIRDEVAWGDRIGSHSWSHPNLTKVPGPQLLQEIAWPRTVLAPFVGAGDPIRCMRPPDGATDPEVSSAIGGAGLAEVHWDVDPEDWKRPPADEIVERVVAHAHPGAVVLLHDGGGDRSNTLAALPAIVAILRHEGYTFVSIC